MKVAVINTYDAKNILMWSGIPFHVSLFLDSLFFGNIQYIKLPEMKRSFKSNLLGFYFNKIKKQKYYTWADEQHLYSNKKMIDSFLDDQYDLIITFEFFLVPFLKKTNNKVIHWNDANFQNLHNYYSGYSDFSTYSFKAAHNIQKQALDLSDIVIYSSEWAIKTAVSYYKIDERKLRIILFASNLKVSLNASEVNNVVNLRKQNIIKLLFIGVDWERKGGDYAVKVLNELNSKGYKSLLYIVGIEVNEELSKNQNIVQFGFINKTSLEGEKKMVELYKECSFFILPSQNDITPVVFSEANSFALPVISTNIGGIPSLIIKNINGDYFDISHFVEKSTNFIIKNLPASYEYVQLCNSSFLHYQNNMSWDQVAIKFKKILKDLSL